MFIFFRCLDCNKGFTGPNSLKQHMQKHSNVRNYQCIYCEKEFQRKSTLSIHIQTHTGDKPYACDICQRRFVQKNDMLKHKKTHKQRQEGPVNKTLPLSEPSEENVESEKLVCDSCDVIFDSKNELNKHKLIIHGITVPVVFNLETNSALTDTKEVISGAGENVLLQPLPEKNW